MLSIPQQSPTPSIPTINNNANLNIPYLVLLFISMGYKSDTIIGRVAGLNGIFFIWIGAIRLPFKIGYNNSFFQQ